MDKCEDHQGNEIFIGDTVSFTRANTVYVGKVVNINESCNPQIQYKFLDFRNKICQYKYTPVHNNRYVKIF